MSIRRSKWPVDREFLTSKARKARKTGPPEIDTGASLVLQNREPDQLPTHTGAQRPEFLTTGIEHLASVQPGAGTRSRFVDPDVGCSGNGEGI